MKTVNVGKDMIILYIIGGLIVLGIIATLWDVLKVILSCVIGIGVLVLIGWGYSLIGYPMWMIWMLVAVAAICNPVCLILYLVQKSKTVKILRKASVVSEDINRVESEEIKGKIEGKISETMAEMGMATDADLYNQEKDYFDNMDILITALDKRKQELKDNLRKASIFRPDVRVIDQALKELTDSKLVIQEMFKKLVESGKIKVESNLNGEDENVQCWEKKLYRSTMENINPSNMLPPMRIELD